MKRERERERERERVIKGFEKDYKLRQSRLRDYVIV